MAVNATTAPGSPAAANPYTALNASTDAASNKDNQTASADRFLKLLVAQLQNQDPLNPLDNAQVTSQMAQINTVEGIQTLNNTVKGLNTQFVQLQALQGASLVGREVSVPGNRLAIADGQGSAEFDLGATADHVKLEVLSGAGIVLDTQELGAMSAGRHELNWAAGTHTDAEGLRYRITATTGAAAVAATPMMFDRVEAVSNAGDQLNVQLLRGGTVPYTDIKSVH